MTTIADSTSLCMRSFSRLTAALATGEQDHCESMPPGKIEAELGRFKIWSGNLGALQSGRSSLDFRLRESTVMQTNVMKLLKKLDLTLQKSIQVANGTRLPLEKLPKPEYLSEESSEDESETGNKDELITTELSQHMLTIIDILADLYKLSFRIRNFATKTKSLKPALYKEIDEETNIDKFAEYAKYDHSHVLESFKQLRKDAAHQTSSIPPRTSEDEQEEMYLAERLAITITRRRRALRYWQRHAKKLADAPALPQSYSVSMNVVADPNAVQLPQRLQPAGHVAALSLIEKSILSGTEATTYDRRLDDSPDMQSVVSYASTAFDLLGNSIYLPPAPVAASRGAEFLCPYCGIICPSRHGKDRAWRAHVLQDLQPYICTYHDCSDAFQMYSSRHRWLEHERLVHRRIWQCFGHANAVFASSSELRDHLQSQHSEGVTEAQIQNLLDVCESSVVDTRTKCPICLIEGPFKRGLDNHLSFHLETFATFSVPRSIFSGEESESGVDGNSENAQGLRSDISTKSVSLSFQSPPASTSSSANKEPKEETRPEQEASTAQGGESPAPRGVGSGPDLALKGRSGLAGVFGGLGLYYFRIDYMRENPSHVPFVAVGPWYPPESLGGNQMIGGGVSGLYWYCDRQSISQVPYLPDDCPHFKTFSVYYHNDIFWASRCDATAVQVGDGDGDTGYQDPEDASEGEGEGWHRLSFDYEDEDDGQQTYSSYVTNAGEHSRLRTQRPDQTWPKMLLPEHYHAPSSFHTVYPQYGGLTGELPLFLALIAFSVDANRVDWALKTCFQDGSWRTHNIDHARQDGRGMVVRVYGGAELEDYEIGVYGKYFN